MELHSEQRYIADIASRYSIPVSLVKHEAATVTCKEKADLLGWDVGRIVKAIYYHSGDFDNIVGVITPEKGKIDSEKLFMSAFNIKDKKDARRYTTNGFTPTGMSKGTCTPFPMESIVGTEIYKLIIIGDPSIDDTLVDISMGDHFEDPHKVSMHLPYGAIHKILQERFPDYVMKL